MLWLQTDTSECGLLNLGGSLTRQFEHQTQKDSQFSHICEIGRLVEQSENKVSFCHVSLTYLKIRFEPP